MRERSLLTSAVVEVMNPTPPVCNAESMPKSNAVLSTRDGLGNRLFQVLCGRLFGEQRCTSARDDRLAQVPQGSHLITNDEALFRDPEAAMAMAAHDAELVNTEGMPADNTLTFWASVLGCSEVTVRDEPLHDWRNLLARLDAGSVCLDRDGRRRSGL